MVTQGDLAQSQVCVVLDFPGGSSQGGCCLPRSICSQCLTQEPCEDAVGEERESLGRSRIRLKAEGIALKRCPRLSRSDEGETCQESRSGV